MKAIADVSIIPLGVGLSLSSYVAACERVFSPSTASSRDCTPTAQISKVIGTR